MMSELPLVSFCLLSYNQKQYLIGALKGAFAQTYRPLEIVISDDGSTDGSWEYIQKAVAGFQQEHPDVAVVINRNEPNLGSLGNWQKCGELAHGELCVKADGDDISLPDRTTRIVEEWLKAGRDRIKVVLTGAYYLDRENHFLGKGDAPTALFPAGAMMSWTKDCFTSFGSIVEPRSFDDVVFGVRALLLGAEVRLNEPLVFYRVGSGATSVLYKKRTSEERIRKGLLISYEQSLVDLGYCKDRLSCENYLRWKAYLEKCLDESRCWCQLMMGKTFVERWNGFKHILPSRIFCKEWLLRGTWLLPAKGGDFVLLPYYFLKYWRGRFLSWLRRNSDEFIAARRMISEIQQTIRV